MHGGCHTHALLHSSTLLAGYIGSLSILQTVVRVAETLRQYNSDLVYGGWAALHCPCVMPPPVRLVQAVLAAATKLPPPAAPFPFLCTEVRPSLPRSHVPPQCATQSWGMMGGCTFGQISLLHSGT